MNKLSIHQYLRFCCLSLFFCLYACTGKDRHRPGAAGDNARVAKQQYALTLHQYGMMDDVYTDEAKVKVLARYGVRPVQVAGCVVDSAVRAAANAHNDSLFVLLSEKYHRPVTRKQLADEVRAYVMTTKALQTTIEMQDFARRRVREMDSTDYHFYVADWLQDTTTGTYFVTVRERGLRENDPDPLLWQLNVNLLSNDVLMKNKAGQWISGSR